MSEEDKLLPVADPHGQVIASIPRDQLRAFFHLFAGKPDSRIRVFEGALHITPQDIVELNACVVRKLRTHDIDASTTSVRAVYAGSEINEFGAWAEFEAHHWQESERIEEIVIKWDFLVNIQDYAAPQRHTLLFRVSTDVRPGKFLQLLSSGNSDEFDSEEMFSAPAFCRVDFINAHISKELINVVVEWHKGRRTPKLIPSTYYWFKKRRQGVAALLDHWIMLSWTLLGSATFLFATSKVYPQGTPVHIGAIALFVGVYSFGPARFLARRMAETVFISLRDLEGSKVVFEFTSGDRKRIAELHEDNAKQGRKFIASAAWNIFLNLFASVLFAYLFASGA